MTNSETRLILHIGMPKTGTTTLQRSIFSHHPDIYYLGKHPLSHNTRKCLTEDIYEMLSPLLWAACDPWDERRTRRCFQERVFTQDACDRVMVGSWEGLVNAPTSKLIATFERMRTIFAASQVMVTVRNPLTWLPSLYLQHLEGHYILKNREWMGPSAFIDIGDWLKKLSASPSSLENMLNYNLKIQAATDILGKENVGVFAFEHLVADPQGFYRGMCDFMDIDGDKGLELSREKHLNSRTTTDQLEYLKQLDQTPLRRWWLNTKSRNLRSKQYKDHSGKGIPAKISLPPEWAEKVADLTREGNRWLAESYNLPLDHYSYPL